MAGRITWVEPDPDGSEKIDERAEEPRIPDPPADFPALRAWAEAHGVADRLADPAELLAAVVPLGEEAVLKPANGDATIAGLLAASPPSVPEAWTRAGAAKAWALDIRARAARIVREAARDYLRRAAEVRASMLVRRDRAALHDPPAEGPLAALYDRIERSRALLAMVVEERPLGTFQPRPATLEIEPLRLVYHEPSAAQWGWHSATAEVVLEEDPIAVRCRCRAGSRDASSCAHALTALDEALDFLRVPSPERDRLASMLATPAWERFLRAFGDTLGGRTAPANERLAWRVVGEGAEVQVEPVLQKRTKGGGFSPGQRIDHDALSWHREWLADPRDEEAVMALGLDDRPRYPGAKPSRPRVARALAALAGHPLLFVQGAADGPARVVHERLSVALESSGGTVSLSFLIAGVRHDAASIAALAGKEGPVIVVDRAARTVVLCAVDERARALLHTFVRLPATFPEAIHDELLRALGGLQESVDLILPDELAGELTAADPRPVVRLLPRDESAVEVEIVARPIEGGPVFRPGEGAATVLHARAGRRVSALRDRTKEKDAAAALVTRLPPAENEATPWSRVLDEQAALDLLGVLRELGDAITVEWAEPDKRLVHLGDLTEKELRVHVKDRRDWFGIEGKVEIDGHAVPLATLIEAVRGGRRYVRVGPGKFAAIAEELRRRLLGAADVLHHGKHGLEIALAGVPFIADLVDGPQQLEAAARFRSIARRLAEARDLDPALPKGLTATLRPYQLEGYKWLTRLAAWGAGACLADDMGLGKTVQTLALLLARAAQGPALVVAPTSVGQNWIDEAARFAPGLRARLYRGPARAALLADLRPGEVLVTSYALLVRDAEELAKVRFATLVLDEAQAIKNALTHRARAVVDLDAEMRIALTGTPVENHLGDLWSLMRVITPGLLGSWEHFHDHYAVPIQKDRDRARSAALARVIRPFVLRRTKAEVTPELPARLEIQRLVEPSAAERTIYDAARLEALATVALAKGEAGRFALLAALTRLRRLACHPRLVDEASTVPSSKLAALLEIVEELRAEGHRALVFSQFTSHLALVREALDQRGITYDYLDGKTPADQRARRVAAFQKGRADLFLISLKAGGSGLNLTAADYVIHLDPWWNPAVEDQATDRAHRIGQSKTVTVIRLVARGTIEEAVLALHGDKRALAASVFDEGTSPAALSTEDLAALIRSGMGAPPAEDEPDQTRCV